ncbi:NAD(P)H-binding protein [Bombilactobacillus bombi]|uniref:NAD(P)H-binding protein n=1 Tax=Bombilactobacillus bombi TaxID=1303590 RepID=UPI0015E5D98F|nr:NAD(P)H-binding protein [Bombilactobacillus bombi]MBA1433843.1 short-chain dehydrogenase [Bombilactobacillus bombi]
MNILILGAYGQIAQLVRQRLLAETNAHLTLYLRNAHRLSVTDVHRETVIEGDVRDYEILESAIAKQDLVYANLGGVFEPLAVNIVKAMTAQNVQRLIYVTGLGLYHEVPGKFGEWLERSVGHEVMEDTRRAAKIIEESTLNYTIIRAAYMNNNPKIDYELTTKSEPFKGTIVSRASIADLIVKICQNPQQYEYSSLGIDQPGTNGDTPQY